MDIKQVKFDVGGRKFVTTEYTLYLRGGRNFLTTLIEGDKNGSNPVWRDKKGFIFLDRNPKLFEVILEYLRTGKVWLPSKIMQEQMLEELRYYQIYPSPGDWVITPQIPSSVPPSIPQQQPSPQLRTQTINLAQPQRSNTINLAQPQQQQTLPQQMQTMSLGNQGQPTMPQAQPQSSYVIPQQQINLAQPRGTLNKSGSQQAQQQIAAATASRPQEPSPQYYGQMTAPKPPEPADHLQYGNTNKPDAKPEYGNTKPTTPQSAAAMPQFAPQAYGSFPPPRAAEQAPPPPSAQQPRVIQESAYGKMPIPRQN